MIRGLYRIPVQNDRPEDVRVDNDGIEHWLEAKIYVAGGYLPASDELPREDEYQAKASRDGGTDPAAAKAERERVKREFMQRFRKP